MLAKVLCLLAATAGSAAPLRRGVAPKPKPVSGLAPARYVFELGDGGLSVLERGTKMSHGQYMVGLAQDPLIVDPVAHVRSLYFPGEPPGVSLEQFLEAMSLARQH